MSVYQTTSCKWLHHILWGLFHSASQIKLTEGWKGQQVKYLLILSYFYGKLEVTVYLLEISKSSNIHTHVWNVFQIDAKLSTKKCVVTPNFLFEI